MYFEVVEAFGLGLCAVLAAMVFSEWRDGGLEIADGVPPFPGNGTA